MHYYGPVPQTDKLLEAIADKYEDLINKATPQIQESLFWERNGFFTIYSLLKGLNIPFEFGLGDVRPWVETVEGKRVEIDFRMKIQGVMAYFGVTAFYPRPTDLKKDTTEVNIPITNLEEKIFKGEHLISARKIGKATIESVRKQRDYLSRKMVVRVAKEGQERFPHDYIYVMFPIDEIGDIDGIPPSFSFESHYSYKETGFTGIMLVGKYVERTRNQTTVRKNKWVLRTNAFPSCSQMVKDILEKVDGVRLDQTEHLRSIHEYLEKHKDDPCFKELLDALKGG